MGLASVLSIGVSHALPKYQERFNDTDLFNVDRNGGRQVSLLCMTQYTLYQPIMRSLSYDANAKAGAGAVGLAIGLHRSPGKPSVLVQLGSLFSVLHEIPLHEPL